RRRIGFTKERSQVKPVDLLRRPQTNEIELSFLSELESVAGAGEPDGFVRGAYEVRRPHSLETPGLSVDLDRAFLAHDGLRHRSGFVGNDDAGARSNCDDRQDELRPRTHRFKATPNRRNQREPGTSATSIRP